MIKIAMVVSQIVYWILMTEVVHAIAPKFCSMKLHALPVAGAELLEATKVTKAADLGHVIVTVLLVLTYQFFAKVLAPTVKSTVIERHASANKKGA